MMALQGEFVALTRWIDNKFRDPFLLGLCLWSAVLLWLSTRFELGVDEAHYVLYGLHPDWSYFDHPPLVGWCQFVAQKLPLPLLLRSRLPALICALVTVVGVRSWLEFRAVPSHRAKLAALALTTSLLFTGMGCFFLPDSLLMAITPWLCLIIEKLDSEDYAGRRGSLWLSLGLLLGLAGLSKYSAIFIIPALAISWLLRGLKKHFYSSRLYGAALLAIVLVLPVFIWNLQNGFASFRYQGSHVSQGAQINLSLFVMAQVSQFVGFSGLLIHGLKWSWAHRREFAGLFVLVFYASISFFALRGNFLPHWMIPAMVICVPAGLASIGFTKKIKWSLGVSSLAWLLCVSELGLAWAPDKVNQSVFRDIKGWQNFVSHWAELAHQQNRRLAVTNWTFGSRFMLYSPYPEEFFVLDNRFDQFDIWQKSSAQGLNFIILSEGPNEFSCQKKTDSGKASVLWKSLPLIEFSVQICDSFDGAERGGEKKSE